MLAAWWAYLDQTCFILTTRSWNDSHNCQQDSVLDVLRHSADFSGFQAIVVPKELEL